MPITDILTPDYVKNAVTPTVRYIDREGRPVSEDAFYRAIDNAVSIVEGRTGLSLRIDHRKLVEERKDSLEWHDATWHLKKPLRRPIQSVTRLGFQYGNYDPAWLPADWVHIPSKNMGQVQIVPGPTGINLSLSNLWFPTTWDQGAHFMAGLIKVEYYAGFDKLLEGTHTVGASSTTVTITGADDLAYDFEPGQWVKLGGTVRRISQVVDGTTYKVTHPSGTAYAGTAIHLQYPSTVLAAVGGLAGAAMLEVAGTLLYGAGVTGKSLQMDGMSQTKGFNPKGPYAQWRQELLEAAEKAMVALHAEYTPIRGFAI